MQPTKFDLVINAKTAKMPCKDRSRQRLPRESGAR
jgi:hypothetical protein